MQLVWVGLALAACGVLRGAAGVYILGEQGDSCTATCGLVGRTCVDSVVTNNSPDIFAQLGVKCTKTAQGGQWWAPNQPGYVTGQGDINNGDCLGYVNVPQTVFCQASYWSVRRICNCGDDITGAGFFGTGISGGTITENETKIFAHVVEDGSYGVMNHFWITAPGTAPESAVIRYYIDGETQPSIEFCPGMAAGIGFSDDNAPRGTKWIGMGAGRGSGKAYFNNFNIPFQKSVVVTAFLPNASSGGFYMIVRGAKNKQITIGGFNLPSTARLLLQKVSGVFQPMDYIRVTDIPSGSGMHFMSTLAVSSGNMNFLEGCYHAYSPYNQTYPGTVLSTGTEDYFDSAWYFDAGPFYFPVSGFTHLNQSQGVTFSAYRFHEQDPLVFTDGFRFEWRNGDQVDKTTGLKCYTLNGGQIVGSPTASSVLSYSWVYVW